MADRQIEYEFNESLRNAIGIKEEDHKVIYHYTGVKGFLLMMEKISENKCYIFPGNCRYQNDENELSEGKKLIENYIASDKNGIAQDTKEFIKKSLNIFSNDVYVTCFSSDDDMLEQWKYYGKDCGLSIGFDFSDCEGFFSEESKEGNKNEMEPREIKDYRIDPVNYDLDSLSVDGFEFNAPTINENSSSERTRGGLTLLPLGVIYDDDEKKRVLQKLIDDEKKQMDDMGFLDEKSFKEVYYNKIIQAFIPLCKNHYFRHEQESRLVFVPTDDTELKYRDKGRRILPYFKFTVVNKNPDKPPIKSVTVGPGATQNLIFNSVIKILDGDNTKFYTETDCNIALEQSPMTKDEAIVSNNVCQLLCVQKADKVNMISYLTQNGILVSKSPIPFRD